MKSIMAVGDSIVKEGSSESNFDDCHQVWIKETLERGGEVPKEIFAPLFT